MPPTTPLVLESELRSAAPTAVDSSAPDQHLASTIQSFPLPPQQQPQSFPVPPQQQPQPLRLPPQQQPLPLPQQQPLTLPPQQQPQPLPLPPQQQPQPLPLPPQQQLQPLPSQQQPKLLPLPLQLPGSQPQPHGPKEADVKLVHGDCIEGIRQLPPSSVDLVIADPPYNIAVQGSAWDTVPDYLAWSAGWLKASIAALRPGGSLFIYGSPAKLWICRLVLLAAELGLEYKQHISWVYKRARLAQAPHRLPKPQLLAQATPLLAQAPPLAAPQLAPHFASKAFSPSLRPAAFPLPAEGGDSRLKGMTAYSVRMEHLEWFVKPGAPQTFHPEAEPNAEADSPDWWDIPRENSRSKERAYGPPHHPSMKPLSICTKIVKGHSSAGEVVLVPFGGSGSECVAAVQHGRRLVAFETDAEYHNLILRRMHGHGLLPSSLTPPARISSLSSSVSAGEVEGSAGDDQLSRDARYTSGYMGVFKHGKKWVAKVMRGGALRNIGVFATPVEAARAYRNVCATAPDDERPGSREALARLERSADSCVLDGRAPSSCTLNGSMRSTDSQSSGTLPSRETVQPSKALASSSANDGRPLPMDATGYLPMGATCYLPMGTSGNLPMGAAGYLPMGTSGNLPMGAAGYLPMGTSGNLPMGAAGYHPRPRGAPPKGPGGVTKRWNHSMGRWEAGQVEPGPAEMAAPLANPPASNLSHTAAAAPPPVAPTASAPPIVTLAPLPPPSLVAAVDRSPTFVATATAAPPLSLVVAAAATPPQLLVAAPPPPPPPLVVEASSVTDDSRPVLTCPVRTCPVLTYPPMSTLDPPMQPTPPMQLTPPPMQLTLPPMQLTLPPSGTGPTEPEEMEVEELEEEEVEVEELEEEEVEVEAGRGEVEAEQVGETAVPAVEMESSEMEFSTAGAGAPPAESPSGAVPAALSLPATTPIQPPSAMQVSSKAQLEGGGCHLGGGDCHLAGGVGSALELRRAEADEEPSLPRSKRPRTQQLPRTQAMMAPAAPTAPEAMAAASLVAEAPAVGVGRRVKARFQAQALGPALTKWYAGEITACHTDGTFDVHYDDGDHEAHVPLKYIKHTPTLPPAPPPPPPSAPVPAPVPVPALSPSVVEAVPPPMAVAVRPPPADWLWPREGDWIEVEVEVREERSPAWTAAQVVVMLIDGQFQARIVLPDGSDEWKDWFTWEEEGVDWRRAQAGGAPAAVAKGAAGCASVAVAQPPRKEKDAHKDEAHKDEAGKDEAQGAQGERAAEKAKAAAPATHTKPPPGWAKVMDFGKLKGYRSPEGRLRKISLPAAWRLYEQQQQEGADM